MTDVTSMANDAAAIEREFALRGLRMAALEWPGDVLPVIAVHGWLDNAASFEPLAPLLQNVHLLAPDLIGHGHSDHLPESADYHLSDSCRWIVALADAMGWQRFALIGHSMGASVAAITAAAVPQRIAGLVMIDGLGPLAINPALEAQRLQQVFDGEAKKVLRPWRDLDSAVKVRQRYGRFAIDTEAAMRIAERGMRKTEDGYFWRHDERLQLPGTHYYDEEQAAAILKGITAPSLLISGEQGAFRGWQGMEARKANMPHLQHIVLPGQHHLHMEQAPEVAAHINEFLAALT